MKRMRGVNFGGWYSQIEAVRDHDPKIFPGTEKHIREYMGKQDFEQVRAWGFDHVRLPIDWFQFFDEQSIRPRENRLELLGKSLEYAAACKLNVILDLHRCPGHFFHEGHDRVQRFFVDASVREDAKRVWGDLAERFGERENVLLEILNEPVASEDEIWNRVLQEMFSHIRNHAKKSTIVVGSNRWNSPAHFADLHPVEDDNVLYSMHCYEPLLFTHQRAPWLHHGHMEVRREYPGDYAPSKNSTTESDLSKNGPFGEWNRARLEQSLEAALTFRENTGLAVACNEFGTYVAAPPEARMRWMNDILEIFRENDIGFSYWNYRNLDFGILSDREPVHAKRPNYDKKGLDAGVLKTLQGG